MIAHLLSIAQTPHGPICVGGLVTMIAKALFLREPLSRLTPASNFTPLDLTFCFNVGMIRHLEPNQFQLLILHEPVYHFTLPDISRTNVHDRKNWIYDLEGIAENDIEEEESDPLTPPHYYDPLVGFGEFDPVTPPPLDRHPVCDPPSAPAAAAVRIPQTDIAIAMDAITMELADIHSDITTLRRDLYGFMDLVTKNIDHMLHSRGG